MYVSSQSGTGFSCIVVAEEGTGAVGLMANQTPSERRAYQNERTRLIKEADNAARTPEIRKLQRQEAVLEKRWSACRRERGRGQIRRKYMDVLARLCELVKHPPREGKGIYEV